MKKLLLSLKGVWFMLIAFITLALVLVLTAVQTLCTILEAIANLPKKLVDKIFGKLQGYNFCKTYTNMQGLAKVRYVVSRLKLNIKTITNILLLILLSPLITVYLLISFIIIPSKIFKKTVLFLFDKLKIIGEFIKSKSEILAEEIKEAESI